MKGTRTDSVGGNEKIKVGSMAQQMVRNDDVESVGGTRTSAQRGSWLGSPAAYWMSSADGVHGIAAGTHSPAAAARRPAREAPRPGTKARPRSRAAAGSSAAMRA